MTSVEVNSPPDEQTRMTHPAVYEVCPAISSTISLRHAPPSKNKIKRIFDIFASAILILFFIPLFLFLSAAIRMDSPGSILFRQRRSGLLGLPFVIYKFRTMHAYEDGKNIQQATRGDIRVTRVGAIMRKLSLDELPQLLNVLKGDMSIVGPRPHALAHDELWANDVPTYVNRFRVRPGLTGYAQIMGLRGEITDDTQLKARVDADNYYVDSWSVNLEVSILLRTLPMVIKDPRAY